MNILLEYELDFKGAKTGKENVRAEDTYVDFIGILSAYEEVERVTYTRAFRVDYPKREEKKGGCKSTVVGGIFAALVSAAAIAIAEKRKNA